MSWETLGIISREQAGVNASVYLNEEGDYYFCCHKCGACGKPWKSEDYAVVQAADHVNYYQHEGHNAQAERAD